MAAALSGMVGVLAGAVGAVAVTRPGARRGDHSPPAAAPSDAGSGLPSTVTEVLSVLPSVAIVVDASDVVINSSASAVGHGLVRNNELTHHELRHLARQVRRDGVVREIELDLPHGPSTAGGVVMRVRVARLGTSHVLLLAEDQTHARRVEETRRDFVANVSHELKTPVGGISLLAEAVLDAKDDPVAVGRFAHRIQVESTRLGRLVQEIVDLSRLQMAESVPEPEPVSVQAVIAEAVDRVEVAAEARSIELSVVIDGQLSVSGSAELLATAVVNLLANAVNYSDAHTRVGVGARRVGETVEIAVTDQGSGIPVGEQERIFERFYRVDAARSRATGGTGLGLAIVKHVCANHGGDVTVWSQEGRGSTFTMRLPAAVPTSRQKNPQGLHSGAAISTRGEHQV
jgi:two-component system, OmpR family, sensor histidine kinase SenX3